MVYWGDLDSLRVLWDRPGVEIRFEVEAAAADAARLLEDQEGVEVVRGSDTSQRISSEVSVGQLLTMLDGHVAAISSIRQSRMRLQELLVKVGTQPPETGDT